MADIILNDPEHLLGGGISEDNVATVTLGGVQRVGFLQVSEDLKSLEYVVLRSSEVPESIKVYFDGSAALVYAYSSGDFDSEGSQNVESIDNMYEYAVTDKTALITYIME